VLSCENTYISLHDNDYVSSILLQAVLLALLNTKSRSLGGPEESRVRGQGPECQNIRSYTGMRSGT
jgi:hypothetical protein